ncbi:hypothetical protein OL548_07205 [Lysinibacillus sp. MHQ-1]|nr:hypothetical protein OL548_07205 [Lysinibacillus sp. MHQ-1]
MIKKSVVSRVEQLVLADFIAQGQFDKHLAKMRTVYRKKTTSSTNCYLHSFFGGISNHR